MIAIVVASLLLCVLTSFLTAQIVLEQFSPPYSVVGTYAHDEQYYVFGRNGSYIRYEYSKPMEEGEFTFSDGELNLRSEEGVMYEVLTWKGGLLVFDERQFVVYQKRSSIPIYVNVEEK